MILRCDTSCESTWLLVYGLFPYLSLTDQLSLSSTCNELHSFIQRYLILHTRRLFRNSSLSLSELRYYYSQVRAYENRNSRKHKNELYICQHDVLHRFQLKQTELHNLSPHPLPIRPYDHIHRPQHKIDTYRLIDVLTVAFKHYGAAENIPSFPSSTAMKMVSFFYACPLHS